MNNFNLFGIETPKHSDKVVHYYIDIGVSKIITTLCDRYLDIKDKDKYTNNKSEVTCLACKRRKRWKLT